VNPHKYGKFLAGTGHEIRNPDVLAQIKPDVVMIMNSIYTEEIGAELARRGVHAELVPL
jgi:hypothetical protein